MHPTSSNFSSRPNWLVPLVLVASSLWCAACTIPQAFAEDEGDEDAAAAEEPAQAIDGKVATVANHKNARNLSTALPAHIWLAYDQALWQAATKNGAAKKIGALPDATGAPTALIANQTGELIAIEMAGVWWLSPAPSDTTPLQWIKLPCQAEVTLQRNALFCLVDAKTQTWAHIRLSSQDPKKVPPLAITTTIKLPTNAQATELGSGDIVWVAKDAVYQAKGTDITQARVIAKEPPIAGFTAAHDGSFALGHFEGTSRKAGAKVTQPLLYSMRLDGIGSKRRSIHNGTPITWSDDGNWALVQDEKNACVVAVAGGHFRCFAGYQGLDLSPSGEWILMRDATGKLMRGQRSGTKAPPPVLITTNAAVLALWDHR